MSLTQTAEVDQLTAYIRLRDGSGTSNAISVDLGTKEARQSDHNDMVDYGRSGGVKVSTYMKAAGQEASRLGGLSISKMAVFIRTLNNRTITVYTTPDAFVESLKDEISRKSSIHKNEYRLEYQGRQLVDGKRLKYYQVVENSTIHMMERLRGG